MDADHPSNGVLLPRRSTFGQRRQSISCDTVPSFCMRRRSRSSAIERGGKLTTPPAYTRADDCLLHSSWAVEADQLLSARCGRPALHPERQREKQPQCAPEPQDHGRHLEGATEGSKLDWHQATTDIVTDGAAGLCRTRACAGRRTAEPSVSPDHGARGRSPGWRAPSAWSRTAARTAARPRGPGRSDP